MAVPRIPILSLGGTIAMARQGEASGVAPKLSAQDLLEAIPEATQIGELVPVSFCQRPSGDLTLRDILELAHTIADLESTGVVVVQGTDTLEETAFALDRLVPIEAPVVVTGAMRNPTVAGADGPGNLLAALRVAADEASRGLGTLVVLNDEIHAARFVRKTHTQNCAAFKSGNGPALGWVAEGRVNIPVRIDRGPLVHVLKNEVIEPVAVVTMHLDADGRMLRQLPGLGYKGVVIAAFGGGHVPGSAVDEVAAVAKEIPTVIAPRVDAGQTLEKTYAFPGSETDLRQKGIVFSGTLDAYKTRILLALLISAGHTKQEISNEFQYWGGG